MVYLLYTDYMKALISRNIHKEVIKIMIEYSCTKLLLMSKWMENDEKLNDDDFVNVLYSVARLLEHSAGFISKLYDWIVNNKIDTPGYLTTLIY